MTINGMTMIKTAWTHDVVDIIILSVKALEAENLGWSPRDDDEKRVRKGELTEGVRLMGGRPQFGGMRLLSVSKMCAR